MNNKTKQEFREKLLVKIFSEQWHWDRDVVRAFNKLNPREKKILEMRIMGKFTLKEVGEEVGVTRERIRQIEAKALEKIRREII